jgi:hypothetical protein
MSEKLKNSRLILNTSLFYPEGDGTIDGSANLDTRMGYADPSRLNCTFQNLDWVMISGDLFDQYVTFSFVIESILYCQSGGSAFADIINITATGLDWQDQTYDVLTKSKGSGCIIYNGGMNGIIVPQSEGFIFRRPETRFKDFTLKITNP